MTSVTRGNGVVTSYEYDVKGRVTNLLSTNNANGIPTALQNVNYTFNVANSIVGVENTPEMDPQGGYHSTIRYSYKYDGLNRLVHSTGFYQRTLNGFEVTEPPKKVRACLRLWVGIPADKTEILFGILMRSTRTTIVY